jgi:hypothetical protein
MKGEELIIEGLSYSGLNMWSTMPISIIKTRLIISILSSLFFFFLEAKQNIVEEN